MEIYKKLLQVQKEVGGVSKDSKNPFFDSKYFDINKLIEHVEPILTKNGLVLLQPIKDNQQGSVIIDSETGESVDSFMSLPNLDNPQKMGSAVTYYRRYTLGSLLALQAVDDDGDSSTKAKHKTDLNNCKTLDELKSVYGSMQPKHQEFFKSLKDELKVKLT